MGDSLVEPLIAGKVIGDVIDMFTPAAEVTAHYGTKQVSNGCEIKPSVASHSPRVQIDARRGSANLYTLVMVDPDAPSPTEPTLREWLHWIVIDIPRGSSALEGKELVPYMGPSPPSGTHRYVFVVFKQHDGSAARSPITRSNFNTRQFASDNGLGLPVAALYFKSHKEHGHKAH